MTNDRKSDHKKKQKKGNLDGKGRNFGHASKKVAVSWTHETCILENRRENMTTYGLIYPKLPYTEKYCDTDSLLYALYSPEHVRVAVDRKKAELSLTGGKTITAKDLSRRDTDQYNLMSDYGRMMAAFIMALRTNDIILMPDITYLGESDEEILTVYHLTWEQGVHLKFNRGTYGNTENYAGIGIRSEKELFRLIDHLLRPLIREMRTEKMEEVNSPDINELPSEFKKNSA